jgi:hypothetical protein
MEFHTFLLRSSFIEILLGIVAEAMSAVSCLLYLAGCTLKMQMTEFALSFSSHVQINLDQE